MVISKDAINTLVSIQPTSVSHASQNTTQTPHPFNALPNGSIVEGYVIKRDGQNNPILRTQAGDVLVTTDVFLKTGTELTLRVDNSHPNHARIVTINGLSPDAFSRVQALSVNAAEDSYQGIALQQANGVNAVQTGTPKPVQIHGVLLQVATQNASSPAVLSAALQALGIADNARRAPHATQAATSLLVTIETIATSEISDAAIQPNASNNNKTAAPTANLATQSQNISIATLGNPLSDDVAITPVIAHVAGSVSAKSIAPIQAEILRAANSTLSTIDTVENLSTKAPVKPPVANNVPVNTTTSLNTNSTQNSGETDTSNAIPSQLVFSNEAPSSKPAIANAQSIALEKNTQNVLAQSQTNLQSFDGEQVAIPASLNTPTPSSASTPAPAQAVPQNPSSSSSLIPISANEIKSESANSQTTLEPSNLLIKSGNEKALTPQSALPVSNALPTLSPASALPNSLNTPVSNPAAPPPTVTQAPVQSQTASSPSINTANFNQNQIKINSNQSIEVAAQVIGRESGGDTIVQTPLGVLKLFTEKPLHVGSVLTLSLSADNSISNHTLPSSLSGDLQELTHLARDWDSLTDTLRALGGSDPQLAATILNDVLPNTGKNLTHGILFFLTALKGGDVRGWFGNKTSRSIDDKIPELLSRLGGDFKALQQASIESTQQGWLSTIIPILHEQTLHQARLFIRHEQEKEGQISKKSQGNRFIIEVDMTQLGEIQFDGYVSKEATRHQFDMMIRTTRPLPLDIQQNIRTIYQNAGEITGFTGMLQFQNTPESFVRPLSSMKRDDLSGLIV